MEVGGQEISNQDVISEAFSRFFRELLGTSAPQYNLDINWEHYYPVKSRPPLLDLEEPFTCEAVFALVADKALVPDDLI